MRFVTEIVMCLISLQGASPDPAGDATLYTVYAWYHLYKIRKILNSETHLAPRVSHKEL